MRGEDVSESVVHKGYRIILLSAGNYLLKDNIEILIFIDYAIKY